MHHPSAAKLERTERLWSATGETFVRDEEVCSHEDGEDDEQSREAG